MAPLADVSPATTAAPARPAASETPTLRTAFKDHFLMGVALNHSQITGRNARAAEIAARQFSSVTGDAGSVAMSTENAFVGKHSPRVAAGSGLRQLDLGVLAGKSYNGYLWARPIDGESEIEVSLAWGESPADRESTRFTITGGDYAKRGFTFTAKRDLERGAVFEIRVLRGDVLLGPPSLMPADKVNGLRADTLALLKQLDSPVYRWSGGNFVSG